MSGYNEASCLHRLNRPAMPGSLPRSTPTDVWPAILRVVGAMLFVTRTSAAIDFDRDIQPLLTAKCLQCHGQTEPEAGLRLTSRETAIAPLESGKTAIVPRKPA